MINSITLLPLYTLAALWILVIILPSSNHDQEN